MSGKSWKTGVFAMILSLCMILYIKVNEWVLDQAGRACNHEFDSPTTPGLSLLVLIGLYFLCPLIAVSFGYVIDFITYLFERDEWNEYLEEKILKPDRNRGEDSE